MDVAHKLIIDTDPGIDDAMALAWLLSQTAYPTAIVGIGIVAGNTQPEQGANNALTVLHTLDHAHIPLAIGEAQPLVYPLSRTNRMIHGPDGLWFAGAQPAHDTSQCPRDVPTFYRDLALANPGATLLALGPLTNLAQTVQHYPEAMRTLQRIVILGGAKATGSVTPVAEYNFWQDPQAAAIVLAADLPITLLPRDAFTAFALSEAEVQQVSGLETAVMQLLGPPFQRYASLYTGMGRAAAATIPDLVAAMFTLDPALGTTQPALVKVMTEPGLTRGQSIIGMSFSERLTMIADDEELGDLADHALSEPDFDMMSAVIGLANREKDNVQVVTQINAAAMRDLFFTTFMGKQG
ncbi:MAG: nucleoside hydrolase [Anaerolineales bacterium]|nr:nucleoside hydrolase [Anaerolineales bacterium]